MFMFQSPIHGRLFRGTPLRGAMRYHFERRFPVGKKPWRLICRDAQRRLTRTGLLTVENLHGLALGFDQVSDGGHPRALVRRERAGWMADVPSCAPCAKVV